MMVLLFVYLQLGDLAPVSIEPFDVRDVLELPGLWAVHDFHTLRLVDHQGKTIAEHNIRGPGPRELPFPLKLIPVPGGFGLSGHQGTLTFDTQGRFRRKWEHQFGPVTHTDGQNTYYGGGGILYSPIGDTVLFHDGKQTRTLIPVSAAVNQNNRLRTTAVVETDGRHLLYGDPVTMKIQLHDATTGKKLKDLPVDWQGVRTYHGRRANRNAPRAWQQSFDYFAYNGAFLAQRGTTLVAGVTWELLEGEQDFVTQIWLITDRGTERLRLDFVDERPIGIAARPKHLSLCTAEVRDAETLLQFYPIAR